MYIDGKWQDEQTTYDIKDEQEEVIKTFPATLKESGLWINDNGVEMLVEPSKQWKAENQPTIIEQPTFEPIDEEKNMMFEAIIELNERLTILGV